MEQTMHRLTVVHLSDIHFGDTHAFNPVNGPEGHPTSAAGVPTCWDCLNTDLSNTVCDEPVAVAVTGDLVYRCSENQFLPAGQFLRNLATEPILGRLRGKERIFVVPGNHDIDYTKSDPTLRWHLFCKLMTNFYDRKYAPEQPLDLVELHDCADDGFCMLTLNSVVHTRSKSEDEYRGQIDNEQLKKVDGILRANAAKLRDRIRIAMIHHHPVLIPSLVESNRQYDAVINSGHLLNLLHSHGFHVVLHGHKHCPCSFIADIRSACDTAPAMPLLIVSGGTTGSTEHSADRNTNCYNRITIRWNPGIDEVRIHLETRGLRKCDEYGRLLPPSFWTWITLREDDRVISRGPSPTVRRDKLVIGSHAKDNEADEKARQEEYKRLRGNMLVAQTKPSLLPGQTYEVIVWVVGHRSKNKDIHRQLPVKVTWSAGTYFSRKTMSRADDDRFTTFFHYYGPMLVCAEMEFEDGTKERAFIYASIPSARDYT